MRLNPWVLPGFFGLFYLLPLDFRGLWMPDESRYAEISREMLASGNWVVPHLLGLRYFEKPIAGYWFNSIAQFLFGHDNFAVRFAPALATGLSAVLILWLTMRLWHSARIACAAALIYLSMLIVYGVGTLSVLDPMFTLWMTAAMLSFHVTLNATTAWRRVAAYAGFGALCGVGFLTKSFIALAVPVVAIVPFMIVQRRFLELVRFGPIAVLAAALVSAPWALAIQLREPDYWRYFFWVEHIQRFAGSDAQHAQPIWYFIPIIALACLPWLGVMPNALHDGWRRRREQPEFLYLLCWILLPLLFFSLAKGKLVTYILPCFAPMAILAAAAVGKQIKERQATHLKLNGAINGVFGLIGVAAMWWLKYGGSNPVYGSDESAAWMLGMMAFAGWSLFGVLQCRWPMRGWALSALCPGLLALLLAWALPQSVINSKQPGVFISQNEAMLAQADTVLANDVGLATSLAWSLKRSDIKLFDTSGELEYGLSYSDAKNRRIDKQLFGSWLEKARQQGTIALLLKYDSGNKTPAAFLKTFPGGYQRFVANDLILLIYPEVNPT